MASHSILKFWSTHPQLTLSFFAFEINTHTHTHTHSHALPPTRPNTISLSLSVCVSHGNMHTYTIVPLDRRIALHKYDPKDLQDAFQEAQSAKKQYGEFNNGRNTHNSGDYGDLNDFRNELIDRLDDGSISRQRALAEAHEQGLLDLVVVDDAKKKERIRRFDGQRPERETASTAPSSLSSPSTRSTSTEAAGSSSFFPVTAASANKVTPSSSQLLSSRLVASGTGREETHQHVVGSKEEEFFDFDGNSFMSEGDMSDDDEDDDLL